MCLGKSDPVTTVLLNLAVSLVATDVLRGVYPATVWVLKALEPKYICLAEEMQGPARLSCPPHTVP